MDVNKPSKLLTVLLLIFALLIILTFLGYKIVADGFSKRQPLYQYNFINSEVKKLPNGKNLRLTDVFLQGKLIMYVKCKIELDKKELLELCINMSKIIDTFFNKKEINEEASVRIFCPNNGGMTFYRRRNYYTENDYIWLIDDEQYPVYVEE